LDRLNLDKKLTPRQEEAVKQVQLRASTEYISFGIDWHLNTEAGDDVVCTTPAGMAHILMRTVQFAKDIGGDGRGGDSGLYYYHKGVYHPGARGLIKWGLVEILSKYHKLVDWKPSLSDGVVQFILAVCPRLWERPPIHTINLLNGLLEWDKQTNHFHLYPHHPNFLSTVQLPITYDPDAKCPGWDKFLKATLPGDVYETKLTYHIAAWLMVPHTEIQKVIFLLGSGANGKSIWLEGLMALIGAKNISHLTLQQIEHDKFAVANLLGKLVNIYADISSERLRSTNIIKAITGGDTITGERKYGDMFSFVPFCRLLFSANDFPQSPDNSDGFYRRLLIIPFHNSFAEDPELGRRLKATLTSPIELSGVLNEALKCFDYNFDWGLPESPSTDGSKGEIRSIFDPFVKWVNKVVQVGEGFVTKKDMWMAFNDAHPKAPMTEQAFSTKFAKMCPQYRIVKKKINGIVIRVYDKCQFAPVVEFELEPVHMEVEDVPEEKMESFLDDPMIIVDPETGEIFEDPEIKFQREMEEIYGPAGPSPEEEEEQNYY
jgi:putative DNA primase/helicase